MSDVILSPTTRRIMAIVSIVYGLFITIVGPFLIQMSMTGILNTLVPKIGVDPHFGVTFLYVFSFFFFFYRGFGVAAGIILVIVAFPLWKGKSWSWPVSLSCISFPTMLSMISIIPYVAHVGGMPPSVFNVLFGLLTFWTVLLLPKGVKLERLARFCVFTFLGLTGGEVSIFVMHNIKELFQVIYEVINTGLPNLLTDPEVAIVGFALPLNVICVLMCIVAIPLLAARNPKGWWFGLIGGVIGMIANYPTQIVRMVTYDFLIAGILCTFVVVFIIVFKEKLIGQNKEK